MNPASPDLDPRNKGQAHAFLIVTGSVAGLGHVAGEGGLDLVTATIRTSNGTVSVGLAPASVFRQSGFMLREGDRVAMRLFRIPAAEPPRAQMIHNRTTEKSIRMRSIRGEPLWDGEGRWHGGFCVHGMDDENASRR